MVDIINKQCLYDGCNTQPSYGNKGDKKASYCYIHKKDGMVNIISKRCLYDGCNTQPSYGNKGDKKASYCYIHKKDGMVNIISKRCLYDGCNIRPSYGNKGGKKASYCSIHKKDGMVNVVDKHCVYDGCLIRANYGCLFKSPQHCFRHKQKNEYPIRKINPKCSSKGCKSLPFYTNQKDNYPIRCEKHQLPDDINVVEKACINCGLDSFIKTDTKLCDSCFDFKIKKVHKAKETRVKNVLDANSIAYTSYDKVIDSSCNIYRPDFVIDLDKFVIIIEVDENQHKSYPCRCEHIRMISIFQSFGATPVVFIRYNPDDYSYNGKKIKYNKSREKVLLGTIRGLSNRERLDDSLSAIHLFYDGFDGTINRMRIDYEAMNTKMIAE
jgi:transposase